jgi:hypothetical protein
LASLVAKRMRRTRFCSLLISMALLAVALPMHAAERARINPRTGLFEPPLADLRKAAERGDRAELARAAVRLGPARLAKGLADSDRRTVLAALEGIPLLRSGILLLDPVAALAGSSDQEIREQALQALSALLATDDAERLAEWEIPLESTRVACQALAAAALNVRETSSLRLLAVQGLADAGTHCASSFEPSKLLGSSDPALRRAAVLALPASSQAGSLLLAATKDSDVRVAAAAAASLCARWVQGQPLPVPSLLPKLALAEGAAVEDVIDMLPCLAAANDPAYGKALETLRERGPAVLRDAIRSLLPAASTGPGP